MKFLLISLFSFALSVSAVAGTVSTEAKTGGPHDSVHFQFSPGAVFYQNYGMGFLMGVGVAARVSHTVPLYVGADLGVGFLGDVAAPFTPTVTNTGATLVQMMPTIYYRSTVASLPNVRTYLGISIGPNIFVQSVPTTTATSSSETKVYFQCMLRPGVDLALSNQVSLLFEPKLGVLRSAFIFNPQIGVVVGI